MGGRILIVDDAMFLRGVLEFIIKLFKSSAEKGALKGCGVCGSRNVFSSG